MKYHIHIYKVVGKAEVDITAENETEARKKALQLTKELEFQKPDCKHIAISFLQFEEEKTKKINSKHKGKFEKRIIDEIVELGKTLKIGCGDRRIALEQCLKWIEEAKKEFPKRKLACDLAEMEEKTGRWWATPSYNEIEQWFKKWFGETKQNE